MQPTVSDAIVEMLHAYGVGTVFGLISTSILDLFDALARYGRIRLIPTQHEQGAAFMADGYARVTGKPAVLLISIGPGATNAITGVAQAYHESSPVVVLCSEATTHVHGRGRSNFHEVDQVALFRPITKWAVRAERSERVPELLRRAFQIAVSGRPGPVYLGIPKDFLLAPAPAVEVSALNPLTPTRVNADARAVEQALALLLEAQRPFVLAGGGVLWSGARDVLRRLAQRLGAPVASTPWHRGILPDDHPLGVGQLGNTGTKAALELAAEADVILVVGSTLSELTTDRYGYSVIPSSARLIQIDIDPEEVGKNYPLAVGLVGDARTVLETMLAEMDGRGIDGAEWQGHPRLERISRLKQEWEEWLDGVRQEDSQSPIGRLTVYHVLRELLDHDAIIVAESGGTAAYTRFSLPAYQPQIFPGDFSAMGSGYCMALGAKIAYPERQVVSLDGDGALMMVLSELQTAVENEINTVALVFHNDTYSNMKYKQAKLFDGRYLGVDFAYPNFARIAEEFGAWGARVEAAEQLGSAISEALAAGRPALLDIMTEPRDQVPPSDIYRRWIQERQMSPIVSQSR